MRLCYPLAWKVWGEPMRSDGRPWHGGRVLVCDDNLLIADLVAEFLRGCGLTPIGPAGRLESAMHMARERALDGAILDLSLNGRPCFPICAILSARRIPFMFLTGYPHAVTPIECRGAPLIAKPFEPDEMKEALANMLGLPEDWSPPEHLRPRSGTKDPRAARRPADRADDGMVTKPKRSVATVGRCPAGLVALRFR